MLSKSLLFHIIVTIVVVYYYDSRDALVSAAGWQIIGETENHRIRWVLENFHVSVKGEANLYIPSLTTL